MNAPAIEISGLTKRFGSFEAVHDVRFTAETGRITGFLGPNGAGKSTTLRMLLGLVRPDTGTAHIAGRPYRDLPSPARTVGAVVDIAAAHPSMTARDHLRTACALSGLPAARIDDVLAAVRAEDFSDRRIGAFSTGMRQRLSLATALLGEPEILVLDEPSNGLDPFGIAWLRGFLRDFVAGGRTVLLSSHVLSEVQQTIDDVVVIDRGRIRWSGSVSDLPDGQDLEQAFLSLLDEGARR
ncbi:ATP-binding cassette domain-containing protein [Aeromicrobium sp. YIM 150415]|uniref:ABC transporter ATP-binding protein n=1 Tax=Aeromicrobium sp. YIM 150415 TaxID=2803912 RepID=UPI0027DD5092|nr:ATP-binding cassette domain-containing protein [Aeromicrobium sp. YIM 150415]